MDGGQKNHTSLVGHLHLLKAMVDSAPMLADGHKRIIFFSVPGPKQVAGIPLHLGHDRMVAQSFGFLHPKNRAINLVGQTGKFQFLQPKGVPARR